MADTYLDLLYRKETELEGMKTGSGWSAWSLAVAKVIFVEYESHHVTLQMLTGNPENNQLAPVPITYAGGGRRSFLGSMPSIGDYCVVGWISSNSSGQASAKRPMVLSWFPPPPMLARDWVPAQEFERGEGMDTTGVRQMVKGISDRERFKLRHMEPGHIVASSAQGSDLVLDESVTLANRRGNEIRLQDQDQALITRSVVTHMAMSGTRVYAGPIQRDANILPTEMFSDGQDWEHADLLNYLDKLPSAEADGRFGLQEDGYLNPALPFRRDEDEKNIFIVEMQGKGVPFGALDPFGFLEAGGFINDEGRAKNVSEDFAYYGGKGFWRYGAHVGSKAAPMGEPHNAAALGMWGFDPEFRVEVAETTDATLPVTEATDNFDADRLPMGGTAMPPMVEFVLGSVVGNDFYGDPDLYGKPIAPKIVNGEGILSSGVGKPIGEHASMMLKVNPATVTARSGSSWVASRKDGKMLVWIENGLQVFVKGGYSFRTASPYSIESTEKMSVVGEGGEGVSLDAPAGPVTINAARPMFGGDAIMSSAGGSEKDQSKDDPALMLNSGGHSKMTVAGSARFSAQESFDFHDADTFDCRVKSSCQVESPKISFAGDNQEVFTSKTAKYTHGGGSSEDGPCRKTEFTSSPASGCAAYPTVVDESHYLYGSTKCTVDAGDGEVNRKLGDEKHIIGLGKRTSKCGTNKTVQDFANGYTNSTLVGGISHKAQLAAMSLTGLTGYSTDTVGKHDANACLFTFTAAANAAAPGSPVTGGSLCPITGLKYKMITTAAYGMRFV